MAVLIDSGPVEPTDRLRDVPQDKWLELMRLRRDFMHRNLSYDCRCLVEFVADAERMFAPLGFTNVEEMIRDGYKLEPEEISVAVEWLKLNPPNEPIALEQAITLGKRGRPKKGEEKAGNASFSKLGTTRATTLARLDHHGHIELAAKVRSGEISANQAAIQVGWRKKSKLVCPNCGHEFTK